jgi:hypothetical protein
LKDKGDEVLRTSGGCEMSVLDSSKIKGDELFHNTGVGSRWDKTPGFRSDRDKVYFTTSRVTILAPFIWN